jgi:Fe-S cluster assembly protein SufD
VAPLTDVLETVPSTQAQHGLTGHSHVGAKTIDTIAAGSHMVRISSTDPDDHAHPTGKDEAWRFTPIRRTRGLTVDPSLSSALGDADFEVSVEAPEPVSAITVSGSAAEYLKGISGDQPLDRPAALAWQAADTVLLVDVPAEAELDEPVLITVRGGSTERSLASHLVIRVGHHAKAQVFVSYEGHATLSENVEIVAGEGASVAYAASHEWDPDTVHLTHHRLRMGRDASIKHSVLSFGGDLVRVVVTSLYDGPGGAAELFGIYFADAGQHLEHRLLLDHQQPHCLSRALYKGALQGAGAHTVWVGDVLIRPNAVGTDTYEMNRNLLLTEGTRADSIPNLEIETGEIVGAGHASATGRFDDDQLFYLLSRGIPEDQARRLVVRGFFAEVLNKIGIPSAIEHTSSIVEQELAIAGV